LTGKKSSRVQNWIKMKGLKLRNTGKRFPKLDVKLSLQDGNK
jgi:hypothetical protein